MAGEIQYPESRAVPRSFFRAPLCNDLSALDADVAFIGVPFDQGTNGRPGARFGPNGVRDANRIYDYLDTFEDREARGLFDIDAGKILLRGVRMVDCGDVTIIASDVEDNFRKITTTVRRILDRGAFPVVVGGDHAITFPSVRAFESFAPLSVVHFDAHMDFTHHVQGSKYTHGCPIRRASELPFVKGITSIGIRSAREQVYKEALEWGVRVISTDQVRTMGPRRTMEEVPQSQNIYLTVDIDVLDPTNAPGTGTPAPGGLSYFELRDCLRALTSRGRIVGFDVVEVAPVYDHAEVTTRNAARLILEVLGLLFPSREHWIK